MGILSKICFRTILGLAVVCFITTSIFAHPGSGIAVDRLGQIFFLDTGSGTWKIDAQGRLTHLSPLRYHWLAIDPSDGFASGRLPTDSTGDWVITKAGSNPTVLISSDFPIAIGPDGNLYYPSVRSGPTRILRATPSGDITTFATLPNAVSGRALPHINGLAAGPDRSIYYAEDSAVRRITANGKVSTIATVSALANGPSIPGTELNPYLRGLSIDPKGVVYVAENSGARVLKITPNGTVTTLLQLESPWAPTAVALYGDILYVLEFLHTPGDDRTTWMPRIRKMTLSDRKSTIILTVDQMPGARPKTVPPAARSGIDSLINLEFLNPFLSTPFQRMG
ncbi:MAG: SMP-30/gluconolactonase/LRE family protein [Pyrinomonadaceae bacterium]